MYDVTEYKLVLAQEEEEVAPKGAKRKAPEPAKKVWQISPVKRDFAFV